MNCKNIKIYDDEEMIGYEENINESVSKFSLGAWCWFVGVCCGLLISGVILGFM